MSNWDDAGFGTDPEGDARRRAELHRPAILTPAVLDDELPYAVEPIRPEVVEAVENLGSGAHAVTSTRYGSTVAIVCACGRWECIVSGPSSAAWAGRDHARHVRDEETPRGE